MKKFKKIFIALGLLATCGLCLTASVFAAEGEETTTPTEEIVTTSKVVISDDIKGGIIEVDKTEGNIGDVVTISYEESLLYSLDKIYVNGVQILANENGKYVFELKEGENLITAHFEVDEEKVKDVYNVISAFKNGDWKQLLTVENLFKLIYFVVTLILSSGFLLTYFRNKKFKDKTVQDLEGVTKENFTKIADDIMLNTIKPIMDVIVDSSKTQSEKINTVVRALIALSDGSGETKLAVLKDLQSSIDDEDKKLIETIANVVENKIKEQSEAEQKTIEMLDEIENRGKEESQENGEETPHL